MIDPAFEKHARARATYLAEAYDIDDATREAFIHDVTLELSQVAQGFMGAVREVAAGNAGLVGEGTNRQMRLALRKRMKNR